MNLVVFEEGELDGPLPKRDPRAVHLVKVLRKKEGDFFEAGLLGEGVGRGAIVKTNADGSLEVSLEISAPPPPRAPVRVAVGFPRPIQARRLLRDLSCMGVEAIDLVGTDLGEKSYRDSRLLGDGGARAAMLEGAAQSRDAALPALRVFAGLDGWLAERGRESAGGLRIAADNVRPAGPVSRALEIAGALADAGGGPGRGATLAVGPERGWSDRERALLDAAGFPRLSMGSRAMRVETACVALVALTLEKIGAFG